MTAWLTIDVVVLALVAWGSVVVIVPSCARSHTRYRLWRLRDNLFDEIRHEAFKDPAPAEALLSFVETSIVCLGELSLIKLVLLRLATLGVGPRPKSFWDLIGDASPADKRLLEPHIDELMGAAVKHVFLGSPSGWICIVVATPFAVGAALVTRLRGRAAGVPLIEDAKANMRADFDREVDPMLATMLCAPQSSRRSLFHSV